MSMRILTPRFGLLGVLTGTLFLAACASVPSGPSMLALPGTGKSMESFRADDRECRQFSFDQIGGRSTPLTGYVGQRQYDQAYVQCMYGKGQRVPVPANMAPPTAVRSKDAGIPPPPPGTPPPPPPDILPPASR